jgi:hypothetical protein
MLYEEAFQEYKKEFGRNFPSTFNFAMISLALLALGIYWPWTLWLTVPLGVLPFFFATEMSLAEPTPKVTYSSALYFRYFAGYFAPPFFGCYRVVLNYLRAFLCGLAVSLLVGLVYYYSAYTVDASFREAIDSAAKYLSNSAADEALNALYGNLSFTLFANIVSLTEGGVALFVFALELAVYGLNPYLRFAIKSSASRMANEVFAGGLRLAGKGFRKDFWEALWLGFVLLVLGFLFGVGMGLLWTGEADRLFAMGLSGSCLFLFMYLPYYFIVVALLGEKYNGCFVTYSIGVAEKALTELKKGASVSEKEAEEIQKSIDEAKNELKASSTGDSPSDQEAPEDAEKKPDDKGPDDPK